MKHTVGLVSLGCNKNKVDAEVMLYNLAEAGYALTMDPAEAEVIIVNTCGFITDAKVEAVNTILDMADYKKAGTCRALIVSGCLPGRYGEELDREMPEVDAWLGVTQYPQIVSIVERVLGGEHLVECALDPRVVGGGKRILTTAPWQAYLKIAEGCDNCCSYCAIPAIRGGYRSRPMEDLTAEARELAAQGVRELIVVAQDTTRYGEDLYGKAMLTPLLEALHEIDGLVWIRVLYCYPEMVDDALLEAFQRLPKLCPYLDIPIQHIDDTILWAMNRRSSREEIITLMKRVRALPRPMALRTTMIVGFPGEDAAAFSALCSFIQEYPFDYLGAFAYSAEDGTVAAEMPGQLEEEVKAERLDRLMALQQGISRQLLCRHVGEETEVLLEEEQENGIWLGRTAYQAPLIDGVTYVSGAAGAVAGTFVRVRITASQEYDLVGEVIP